MINDTGYGSQDGKSGYTNPQVMLLKNFNGDFASINIYRDSREDCSHISTLDIRIGDDESDQIVVSKKVWSYDNGPYQLNTLLGGAGEARFNYSLYVTGNIYRNGSAVATASLSKSSVANADSNQTWQY